MSEKSRIAIFTQDERIFLPIAVERLISEMPERIVYVALCSPMSTHGGWWKGLKRHLPVFGLRGTVTMAARIAMAKIGPLLVRRPQGKRHWSIADAAREYGIPVLRLGDVNAAESHEVMDRYDAQLLVSVSCPQILRKKTLDRFSHGAINVHSSPLPNYRGLMPAFWVLYHGESETAVTAHVLDSKIDNGDILLQRPVPIAADETWDSLVRKTKTVAGEVLVEVIRAIEAGTVVRRNNDDDEATYFSFPTKEDVREFRRRGKRMF